MNTFGDVHLKLEQLSDILTAFHTEGVFHDGRQSCQCFATLFREDYSIGFNSYFIFIQAIARLNSSCDMGDRTFNGLTNSTIEE